MGFSSLLATETARRMGSSVSTGSSDAEPTASVLGVGVGALVREIGMAMIPVHLKHSYESIMQIVGEKKQ